LANDETVDASNQNNITDEALVGESNSAPSLIVILLKLFEGQPFASSAAAMGWRRCKPLSRLSRVPE
jgi:hypothetical protein